MQALAPNTMHLEQGAQPELEALAALERGDFEGALTALMRAYGGAVYRYCLQVTADATLAEEAHQMTFVQAFEGLSGFGGRSSLRSWLFGIARHRCLDALKIARRRRRRFEAVAELPEPPSPEPAAEQSLLAAGMRQALRECLAALAPKVRAALALRFQESFTFVEMAAICRERAATLQARVARALPLLRRCLEARGFAP